MNRTPVKSITGSAEVVREVPGEERATAHPKSIDATEKPDVAAEDPKALLQCGNSSVT